MDKEKIRYIITYYSHFMTDIESKAFRHWQVNAQINAMEFSSLEEKERRIIRYYETGWLTRDLEALSLLQVGIEDFEQVIASRIISENIINFNLCPKCAKLARTPKAKQCRFCSYDWH